MSDILKEAIADAKAVRETALQNEKMALEEAFTPQLKSMLSAKLKEEEGVPFEEDEVGDGLDDEEVEADVVDTPEGTDGEADDSAEEQAPEEPSATAGEDEESGVPGSAEETEYEEEIDYHGNWRWSTISSSAGSAVLTIARRMAVSASGKFGLVNGVNTPERLFDLRDFDML